MGGWDPAREVAGRPGVHSPVRRSGLIRQSTRDASSLSAELLPPLSSDLEVTSRACKDTADVSCVPMCTLLA